MKQNFRTHPVLLIADDNPDDRLLIQYAWSRKPGVQLLFVQDGQELIDVLMLSSDPTQADTPYPSLIFLDLRMPRKNGFEVLEVLKSHHNWKSIPIVVITTSASPADIDRVYGLGANSYIVKPQTVHEILAMTDSLYQYWFSTVCLPT